MMPARVYCPSRFEFDGLLFAARWDDDVLKTLWARSMLAVGYPWRHCRRWPYHLALFGVRCLP